MTTQTCTDHCGTCDRHFHGLGAFDAHRQDGECIEPVQAVVTSRDGSTRQALQVWTDNGECRLGLGRQRITPNVTIWQVWQSEAQKESLAALGQRSLL